MTQALAESPLLAQSLTATPGHHPAIETLAEYAAGQMRAGFDLVVAAHLRGCVQCRDEVARLESLGGGLLDTIEPARLTDGALAATMARLEEPLASPAGTAAPARTLDALLEGARRRWIGPGIWIAPIDTPHDPDDRVFLLRMGGGAVPPHIHGGAEMAQVLVGTLSDDGVIYRPGDLVEPEPSHLHAPMVAGEAPCICLFAMQGRLKPTTLLGRIAFAVAGV